MFEQQHPGPPALLHTSKGTITALSQGMLVSLAPCAGLCGPDMGAAALAAARDAPLSHASSSAKEHI